MQQGNTVIISGKEIKKNLGSKIILNPFNEKQLGPNSYNLRLHNELLQYENYVLDMKTENKAYKLTIPNDGLVLKPHTLYLGRTVEYTETDYYVPMLEGRSSIGRTAGFGDVGFKGYWTLEIFCVQPIRIYPETEICQIFYHTIEGDYDKYKSNKYQNNRGVQPSLLYKDFEK
jgi:dCTP deaminase